jgi:hypothetical protein
VKKICNATSLTVEFEEVENFSKFFLDSVSIFEAHQSVFVSFLISERLEGLSQSLNFKILSKYFSQL